jgi:hypothetical protein
MVALRSCKTEPMLLKVRFEDTFLVGLLLLGTVVAMKEVIDVGGVVLRGRLPIARLEDVDELSSEELLLES